MINKSNLYEKDFYKWTLQTAQMLKEKSFTKIDIKHLIEEVESMGASDYRELRSRLIILIAHLLKWEYQPKERSSGWIGTIEEQRIQLQGLIDQSPSLNNKAISCLENNTNYMKSLNIASRETMIPKKAFPQELPYSLSEILDDDFFPEAKNY
ncbi:DUF29 domain-containing protein, partial [Francisella philomiragia]|uniref:DUF29 domain-containing protein n=1 Tax=Francisella philomiragia TaxID=28110 RepID=UPI0035180B6A